MLNDCLTSLITTLFTTPTAPALRFTARAGCASVEDVNTRADQVLAGFKPDAAVIIRALAQLWHDHYDASHDLCQEREGQQDADYVHALLHRREGDAGNAGYWFKLVGRHPVFAEVAQAAQQHGLGRLAPDGQLDALAVVRATMTPGADEAALIALQADEIRSFVAAMVKAGGVV